MRTVLCGTAARLVAGVSLTAGIGAGVVLAVTPALAAGHPPAGQSRSATVPAPSRPEAKAVQIGTAVAYVREADGSIRQIRP